MRKIKFHKGDYKRVYFGEIIEINDTYLRFETTEGKIAKIPFKDIKSNELIKT